MCKLFLAPVSNPVARYSAASGVGSRFSKKEIVRYEASAAKLAGARDVALRALERETKSPSPIGAALARIGESEFGMRSESEEPISPGWLPAVPCLRCQDQHDSRRPRRTATGGMSGIPGIPRAVSLSSAHPILRIAG